MINRARKLRWRRNFRRHVRQVEGIGVQTEQSFERHFFRRLGRLYGVRRFVSGWILLLTILIGGSVVQSLGLSKFYQELKPAPGGTFTEGIIGSFTNANPLYSTNSVDSAVSKLIFSGLFKYDQDNRLVGDLAKSVSTDAQGTKYTVVLKDGLSWHDGAPLTSADVAFTYQTIQNPDARSPLFSGWKGIKIETPNASTIVFTLPTALSSFPQGLTNGIVPKHILSKTMVEQLRTDQFNTVRPIGSGPFKWETIEVVGSNQETREERIGLLPNDNYHGSEPKLQHFVVRTFRNGDLMSKSYKNGELNSMTGLSDLPENLSQLKDIRQFSVPLAGATMVFFKTSQPPLNDAKVRKALVQSVDVKNILAELEYPAIRVQGPLLTTQLGFDKKLTQLPYNKAVSKKLLDEAGWKLNKNGVRSKAGQVLTIKLFAKSNGEYATVTKLIQDAWHDLGVQVDVQLQEEADLQGTVSRHDYDALLYSVSIGEDPDVFAYWHSSQAEPGSSQLNLSEYKSAKADDSLEAGRTRSDKAIRAVKYKPFLEAWRSDAPALALYQPRFFYVTRGDVFNFNPKIMNSATDRFSNVENWMIRKEKMLK